MKHQKTERSDLCLFTDGARYKRQGFPEAVYCPGKTIRQIKNAANNLYESCGLVLLTRADEKIFSAIKKVYRNARYHKPAKIITLSRIKPEPVAGRYVCVLSAGTSDVPVAEESAVVCEALGSRVMRMYDVGVAGVHRLFKYIDELQKASCVVVCAGMEGALPSIVGGLVGCPVIGVPTSVGYGTNFGGISALLTMLNSCTPNVCVVNVDDGFGAGVTAHLINKK